jgi:hypothetical protein
LWVYGGILTQRTRSSQRRREVEVTVEDFASRTYRMIAWILITVKGIIVIVLTGRRVTAIGGAGCRRCANPTV